MKQAAVVDQAHNDSWRAKLSLKFAGREDKTVIKHRRHEGPLVIQKPFYPEDEVCHVYLLHPPGGVVGGDQLNLVVDVEQQGHALITTPAAGKFYLSDGRAAKLEQTLRVRDGSTLEWLPQETILFSGSEVKLQTKVQLEDDASFIGWEILCLGRPASGEDYERGSVQQSFEIWRQERPLTIDRARFSGGEEVLHAKWGLQDYTVSGSMMMVNANTELLEDVRHNLPEMKGMLSATLIDDVLVCRGLANQAEHLRLAFVQVWKRVRRSLVGRDACEPRIWST